MSAALSVRWDLFKGERGESLFGYIVRLNGINIGSFIETELKSFEGCVDRLLSGGRTIELRLHSLEDVIGLATQESIAHRGTPVAGAWNEVLKLLDNHYHQGSGVSMGVSGMPIKMTKDLPVESSHMYFWAPEKNLKPVIGTLLDSGMFSVGEFSDMTPEELGGYWAKVEKDQFEFEG